MDNIYSFVQGLLIVVATTLTTATAASSPASTQQQQRPVLAQDTIRAEDIVDYMNQKTTYYIDIPISGGKISGKMSGLCSGNITGQFNGQTVDFAKTSDRHDITGELVGTCKVGLLPVSASAKFYGEVSLSSKKVSLTADVEKPFRGRYYPYLRIQ